MFPLLRSTPEPANLMAGMTWAPTSFRYLGIRIFHSLDDMCEGNVGGAVRSLKGNVAFWKTLSLPVISRVTLIKMIALPRMLYHLVNLPMSIPLTWSRQLE